MGLAQRQQWGSVRFPAPKPPEILPSRVASLPFRRWPKPCSRMASLPARRESASSEIGHGLIWPEGPVGPDLSVRSAAHASDAAGARTPEGPHVGWQPKRRHALPVPYGGSCASEIGNVFSYLLRAAGCALGIHGKRSCPDRWLGHVPDPCAPMPLGLRRPKKGSLPSGAYRAVWRA
jgi:hypothetical protein